MNPYSERCLKALWKLRITRFMSFSEYCSDLGSFQFRGLYPTFVYFKNLKSRKSSDFCILRILTNSESIQLRCMKSRPILVNCAKSKFKYSELVTLQFWQYGAFWLLIECVQFTLSYTLHVSDKIGDAILHGISIKIKDTELD
jgi:hypothetical protein